GVYGDHDGAWVDETSDLRPVSQRSLERVAAEQAWAKVAQAAKLPLSIFRLSGIYGPGRNWFINIEKGRSRRLIKPGQVFNRIHRDDIGSAVAAAMGISADGIFNITDDDPAPPQDVVTYAHQLMGKEPPPEVDFETADISPMARSFYGENKRVRNDKSKSVLKMKYAWPNYRTALKRLWDEGSWK
ncbi:MAG: NAD(P)-dependent oxidoreductase, partial [Pseudomonadota bacterium]